MGLGVIETTIQRNDLLSLTHHVIIDPDIGQNAAKTCAARTDSFRERPLR